MKIRVASIADMARAEALTPREWEALGRLAVRIEEIPTKDNEGYFKLLDAYAILEALSGPAAMRTGPEAMADLVLRLMKEEGLVPADWTVFTAPVLPKRATLPRIIEEWVVDLRMTGDVSTAKLGVLPEKHTPTLSEQHGDKR